MRGEVSRGGDEHVRALLRATQGFVYPESGLYALYGVEVPVLPQERRAKGRYDAHWLSPAREVAAYELARLVHLLSPAQQLRQSSEQPRRVQRGIRWKRRQRSRRHVQEAVEVYAHGRVEHTPQQLR